MVLNPSVMKAVEQLDYRVTIGDVATQSGLDVKVAERDLLELASEAGGHLQVAESGDVAYLFPRNFRGILQNKYLRLRLQKWWNKVWESLFYLIRISFGILLIVSIVLIFVTILVILMSMNSRNDGGGRGSYGGGRYGGGRVIVPWYWLSPNWFYVFRPDYYRRRTYYHQQNRRHSYNTRSSSGDESDMNFLEAVFSFLFGDGNPNADLEEKRWQAIGSVIRNNGGAITAEQVAPYLDNVGKDWQENEDYILPVLTRFNGRPEVSPDGQIIYHFPELQVTAKTQQAPQAVSAYLRELPWRFSQASSGQIIAAAGLGGLNIVGALVLGNLLQHSVELGGLVAFVGSIYWLLLAYGIGFLAIPLIRYFWVQWRNKRVEARNETRQERAVALIHADEAVQQKLAFAQQFASESVVDESDLAYTTEQDLTEQEYLQSDKVDEEWERRLGQPGT
jgi:hypothetical protein